MQQKMEETDDHLKEVLLACRRPILYIALFSCVINILMLAVPIYTLQVFDRVLTSQSKETLLYLTLITVFFLIVMAAITLVRTRIALNLSQWFERKISLMVLKRLPDSQLQGETYPQVALKDIAIVRQTIAGQGMLALFDAPWLPIYLLVIYCLHPMLGMIATIGAITLILLTWINEMVTKQLRRAEIGIDQNNNQMFNNSLRNAAGMQAMGMSDRVIQRWFNSHEKVLYLQALTNKRSAWFVNGSKTLRFLLQVLMLGGGAYLVISHSITPGMMIAGTILLARALAPVEQLIGAWQALMSGRSAYHRLLNYINEHKLRKNALLLPEPKGRITVEHASYHPENCREPILYDINFSLEPGEMLTIIGASSSGKTTLANLLVGAIRAHRGSVRLDNADVYSWNRHEIGNYIGYVPQQVDLLPGTIKANIARFQQEDAESIIAVSQLLGMHDMILQLPNAYETVIETQQSPLSGGQRQRIALAQAFYGQPKLIILDEPDTYLDQQSQLQLLKALKLEKQRGATIIIISHRRDLLKITDQIMVMDKGKVSCYGSRNEIFNVIQQTAGRAGNGH